MDIQAKIMNALADFDDLLLQGLTIEAALRIAASENGVSELALATRASRGMLLEERREMVIRKARADRQAATCKATQADRQAAACKAAQRAHLRPDGYWRKLPSGKKVWVDPSQFKFDF
jgi:hypothetical protein